ncbi:MAG: putative undecaprenyl-phosphate N-acetylglucosaminyl 1-phosphate transferase [Paraeggerthella hongkongensis]|uniref:glycosyltransferase family 4 protein n=1 Tax=Paraeggerthella sp. Marseille-Q4926 TaxID=2866587 RepID=UPI001CE4A3EF|nr:MraY family glycosyltransferase [Paraeggerthella sp. Marseille-Q4926]
MEWYQAAIVFCVAFAVTCCMVPVSKWIAVKIGAIDYPGNRRVNVDSVPRCGGIALYTGLLAACFSIYLGVRFFDWNMHDLYVLGDINYIVLFLGVTAMFTVGLVDDITQLSPGTKLLGQVLAAAVVVLSGVGIGAVRAVVVGDYFSFGWLDYPLTVLYLVVFVNITNLIDGLDGLASGLVAIASSSLLYLVWMRGSFTLVLVCIALIAVCLAFLRFNFFPASVFMGDSGSHLLGLSVGIVSVAGVVRTQSFVVMLIPLIIAGVPVLDTLSAIIRRKRVHKPVDQADLGHIHHRLMRAGLSQKRSVAVLWLCSAALALTGCLIGSFSGAVQGAIIAALAIVLFFVIWKFGLFKPVLRHHYDNKGRRGPRVPRHTR